MLLERTHHIQQIHHGFEVCPIVAILGPRQCGKTTLARDYANHRQIPKSNYFDLEDPDDIRRLEQPMNTLSSLTGLIVIDEIQRRSELFPVLRVLADKPEFTGYFIILGSASRELIAQSSESLAGRIIYLELTPFNYLETGDTQRLWLQGGFPAAYLAKNEKASFLWRKNYIKTYLEQDIPNLGIRIPAPQLLRFWMMLAHYHGNIFNASEIARSLGLNYKTVQSYLDILSGTFMVRQLQPWHENINKRQVRSKKIYFRDSGLFHALLNIADKQQILVHPKLGCSWEGFALEEIARFYERLEGHCFFWAIHQTAELDLLVFYQGKRIGFEFKFADAPTLTKSMHSAMELLTLDQLYVIYPGQNQYALTEKITVSSLPLFFAAKQDS